MPFVKRKGRFPAAKVDLVLEDNGLFLMEYGIAGDIVDTTGHTYGSISVILESGEAFVGCLAQKGSRLDSGQNCLSMQRILNCSKELEPGDQHGCENHLSRPWETLPC
jgi:hypothetical protein